MNIYFVFPKTGVQQKLALHPEFIRMIVYALDNHLTLCDGGPYAIDYPRELQVQGGEVVLVDSRMEDVYSQPLSATIIDKMRSKARPMTTDEFASRSNTTSQGDVFVPWR